MDIEDRLGRMLDADAARTAVPVHTIVAEATRRGRKLRRRRRIVRCLGAVLAVGLIAGGAAVVRLDPFGRPPAVAPAGGGVSDPATPAAGGSVEATPAGLLGVFAKIGTATAYRHFTPISDETDGLLGFQVDQDLGQGVWSTVRVQMTFDTFTNRQGPCPASPYFPVLTGPEGCAAYTDGVTTFLEERPAGGDGLSRRIVAQRPGGPTVEITSFDGVLRDSDEGPILQRTLPGPPLTATALADLAASTAWGAEVDAVTAGRGAELARAAGLGITVVPTTG
ncbi:hypothetical protein [Kitasatospora sp. NBC_01539]|uniref:hypothetical protein n=1 Tax=Kitasatospora sp. NBC_01539 TaxID=2903577 RepID=UPI0038602791